MITRRAEFSNVTIEPARSILISWAKSTFWIECYIDSMVFQMRFFHLRPVLICQRRCCVWGRIIHRSGDQPLPPLPRMLLSYAEHFMRHICALSRAHQEPHYLSRRRVGGAWRRAKNTVSAVTAAYCVSYKLTSRVALIFRLVTILPRCANHCAELSLDSSFAYTHLRIHFIIILQRRLGRPSATAD